MYQQAITKEKAIQKIKHYCAYQERSHYETKEKLYSFKLRRQDVEEILALLIEEDYLNEERFAQRFASGRFSLKKWGRKKIEYELKQKQVSAYNIKTALKQIDELTYKQTLLQLAEAKWNSLKHEQYINRQAKTTSYLLQKGFEASLVQQAVTAVRGAK